MNQKVRRSFLVLLIAFAVSAAALILTLPALFGPHEPGQATTTVVLGGLTVLLAVAALLLRPTRRRSACS